MAQPNGRARTPAKKKPSQQLGAAIRIEIDGVEVIVDAASATIRERWHAKEALRAENLPTDDDELLMGAVIWVMARRSIPDITLADVLDGVTLGALMDGAQGDPDSPE